MPKPKGIQRKIARATTDFLGKANLTRYGRIAEGPEQPLIVRIVEDLKTEEFRERLIEEAKMRPAREKAQLMERANRIMTSEQVSAHGDFSSYPPDQGAKLKRSMSAETNLSQFKEGVRRAFKNGDFGFFDRCKMVIEWLRNKRPIADPKGHAVLMAMLALSRAKKPTETISTRDVVDFLTNLERAILQGRESATPGTRSNTIMEDSSRASLQAFPPISDEITSRVVRDVVQELGLRLPIRADQLCPFTYLLDVGESTQWWRWPDS